jgi:hypothetical protein
VQIADRQGVDVGPIRQWSIEEGHQAGFERVRFGSQVTRSRLSAWRNRPILKVASVSRSGMDRDIRRFLADSSESCTVGVRTSLIPKELEFGKHLLRCASKKN